MGFRVSRGGVMGLGNRAQDYGLLGWLWKTLGPTSLLFDTRQRITLTCLGLPLKHNQGAP